jgi:hypothetical protein
MRGTARKIKAMVRRLDDLGLELQHEYEVTSSIRPVFGSQAEAYRLQARGKLTDAQKSIEDACVLLEGALKELEEKK